MEDFASLLLTDQIFTRPTIRTIQGGEENKVGESFEDAFSSIVNYCVAVQLRYKFDFEQDELVGHWNGDAVFKEAFELMEVRIMIMERRGEICE